jgi:hypothetical protein
MPFIFTPEVIYQDGKWNIQNIDNLTTTFPFLRGNVLIGKFLSYYKEDKTEKIDKNFKCKISPSYENKIYGTLIDPNPLKSIGLPVPSYLLAIAYKYTEKEDPSSPEIPIAENALFKQYSSSSYFEHDIKRIQKIDEAKHILEGTVFDETFGEISQKLKEAYVFFEQENYSQSKTSCRIILENIKKNIGDWKKIDGSEGLNEKFRPIVNSLYSFASIGGPHAGVTTREETDFILKNTTTTLFYVNSLLKNERIDNGGIKKGEKQP